MLYAGRTRPKLPAEVDWWDRTKAECITITMTIACQFYSRESRSYLPGRYGPLWVTVGVRDGVACAYTTESTKCAGPGGCHGTHYNIEVSLIQDHKRSERNRLHVGDCDRFYHYCHGHYCRACDGAQDKTVPGRLRIYYGGRTGSHQ